MDMQVIEKQCGNSVFCVERCNMMISDITEVLQILKESVKLGKNIISL